jgi:integrase
LDSDSFTPGGGSAVTYVRGEKRFRRDVISEEEFREMLERAAENQPHPYYALRNRALLCVFQKTGKRRGEIARLEIADFKVDEEEGLLHVPFTVLKIRYGSTVARRRTKTMRLKDPYVKPIVEYFEYLKRLCPECRYLFPSTRWNPKLRILTILKDKPLSGRQILNIVVRAGPMTWPHLFRETQ